MKTDGLVWIFLSIVVVGIILAIAFGVIFGRHSEEQPDCSKYADTASAFVPYRCIKEN